MAIDVGQPELENNSVLKWKVNGAYAFWDFPSNDRKVTHVSEEFLEGLVLSDGIDDDEGYIYPVESRRKYCEDAPHEGANIPASVKGNTAGTFTGQSKNVYGETLLQVEMPFVFFNLDGSNHDDNTKTLLVWVNIKDVVKAADGSEIVLKKVVVINEDTPNPDGTPKVNVLNKNGLQQQQTPTPKKSKMGLYIGVGVSALALIGGIIYYAKTRQNTQGKPNDRIEEING